MSDDTYAFQRSEILDDETCNFCLSIDGLVVNADDPWLSIDTFHEGCRGVWVRILKDEVDPPEITGIPDEIRKCYNKDTKTLVQPPKPIIIRKGSLAEDEVLRRTSRQK